MFLGRTLGTDNYQACIAQAVEVRKQLIDKGFSAQRIRVSLISQPQSPEMISRGFYSIASEVRTFEVSFSPLGEVTKFVEV